ncbi:MAG: hypothetical protein V7L13_16910 [Nostoc sp.]|uniref:hypothetical protein n=1 Tax=Nostoc sp. TaxID=1180 RepID=UPI002FF83528
MTQDRSTVEQPFAGNGEIAQSEEKYRSLFTSIDEVGRWNSEGVMRLPDKVCLSEQISKDFRVLAHAGETVASEDTGRNLITKGEANAAIHAISFITVPNGTKKSANLLFTRVSSLWKK